ncbi:MAG: glycosyltransferase family 4 protein, partial [Planctomycetota bacterium]
FTVPDGAVPGRLLFVGAIEPRKGLLDLVRALPTVAKERPDVRLHVVGRSTDSTYATAVKAAVERERLDRFVVWRGALDERALLEAFASCSILVLPSAEEDFPLAVAQAMAAGKPVVAHAVGGIPSLVADGESGLLVTMGHPTAMADALLALIEDEPRRRAIGEHAAALAREQFDPGLAVERTAALYRELLAPAAERPAACSPEFPTAEDDLAALPTAEG